jgi:hypothetical protein
MALVALMLAAFGPGAGEARAEVSIHLGFGYGYGYGNPYGHYRHRGYGYPYRYSYGYGHSYRYPRYRSGYTYVRPYYADQVGAPSRSAPPPAAPAAAARPPYDTSFCREYTRRIVIDGEEQTAYGTACRQFDGTWRILN